MDSYITFLTSYFARLKYVHNNAVKHQLVKNGYNATYDETEAGHKIAQGAGFFQDHF